MPTPEIWNDPEYRARLHDYASPTTYCQDDAIAPGDKPFICTKEHGHPGDHEAWGTDREAGPCATWRRGEGKEERLGM
jgi:hypothetical protein